MDLNMNRNCILFIKPMVKLSAFLGIVPFYNFDTHSLTKVKTFKLYGTSLACLLPALTSGLLYLRFNYIYIGASRNFVIVNIILETLNFASLEVSILGSACWNMTTWQRLFQLLHQMENKHNLNVKPSKNSSIFVNANFIFFLGTLMLFLLYSCDFYYHFGEKQIIYSFVSTIVYFYIGYVQINVLSNIALSIRCKYEGMRDILEGMTCTEFSEDTIKRIRKVKMLFLTADEIITMFNKLFGFPILLKLAHVIAMMLASLLVFSVAPLKISGVEYHRTALLILLNSGYVLMAWVWSMAIIFCCDAAVEASNKLLVTCYRMEQLLQPFSDEKEELMSLENILKTKSPAFTAAGFFEIKKSTLLSLLSTTATYFVVSIQFSSE